MLTSDVAEASSRIEIADINEDAQPDIVVFSETDAHGIFWLENRWLQSGELITHLASTDSARDVDLVDWVTRRYDCREEFAARS